MYESALRSFSLITVQLCEFLVQEYLQKAACKMLTNDDIDSISISPTFYNQLSHTKVYCPAFICLKFVLCLAKAACKMLMKLNAS
jgi:hypothetical protein